jgi:glutamate formiminotransferase/formiminotetrahydrofolate cyclodeaminase
MPRPLIEIVPNFSEGRRQDVIDAIVASLQVPGVILLNTQWDPDHNRLDCTLIGSPDAVKESATAGARTAIELIDMEQHEGSHPRMGAVDVIPFLPVRDATMEDCVDLARSFGRELADALHVPVYLYDRAALSPDRASLAEVRKGQFEGLRDAVARGERLPDFGPHAIGKAGAVAVGARKPLVAFNAYFAGDDDQATAAKAIAKAVRESSGGLKNVRAVGFAVPERGAVTTVSMNLVDTEATPIHRALELVKIEASRYGLVLKDTEIVGLVPERALADSVAHYLQLEGFSPDDQILESIVARAEAGEGGGEKGGGIRSMGVDAFLEGLASDAATPGGGSVAAVAGAAGAALVAMVGRLTAGKQAYEAVSDRMTEIVKIADDSRAQLLALADRDAEAFDAVMASFKLPKDTDVQKAERSAAIQAAFAGAAEVPLEVARMAVGTMALAVEVVEHGNPNAASDGLSAAHMLGAASASALANVEINAASLKDTARAAAFRADGAALRDRSAALLASAVDAFGTRIG